MVKLGRYWSPWPNAEGFRSPVLAVASTVVELPLFGLMVLGAWDRRRDPRAWALLAGPLLYFCALPPGLRQLDALSHPRRDARAGLGGDRMDDAGGKVLRSHVAVM